jgi:hypothetical protein
MSIIEEQLIEINRKLDIILNMIIGEQTPEPTDGQSTNNDGSLGGKKKRTTKKAVTKKATTKKATTKK